MKKGLMVSILLVLCLVLASCGTDQNSNSKKDNNENKVILKLQKTSVTTNDDGEYSVSGETTPGASVDVNAITGKVNKKGHFKVNGNFDFAEEVEYTVTASKKGMETTTKKVKIVPSPEFVSKVNEEEKEESANPFGEEVDIGNESLQATIKFNYAKRITDRDNPDIADLSHNYSSLQDFVLVDYTYTGITDIDDYSLDGSNFTFLDDADTVGMVSSNRGMPIRAIKSGQSMHTQIGVGFENKGEKIQIQIGNLTFTGNIE